MTTLLWSRWTQLTWSCKAGPRLVLSTIFRCFYFSKYFLFLVVYIFTPLHFRGKYCFFYSTFMLFFFNNLCSKLLCRLDAATLRYENGDECILCEMIYTLSDSQYILYIYTCCCFTICVCNCRYWGFILAVFSNASSRFHCLSYVRSRLESFKDMRWSAKTCSDIHNLRIFFSWWTVITLTFVLTSGQNANSASILVYDQISAKQTNVLFGLLWC